MVVPPKWTCFVFLDWAGSALTSAAAGWRRKAIVVDMAHGYGLKGRWDELGVRRRGLHVRDRMKPVNKLHEEL